MNVSELKVKPCPFCGSDDISFSAFSISDDAYALCGNCNAGIEIQVGWDEMTEKEHDEVCAMELQKVWNRRFVEQPQLNENQQIVLEWLKNEKESSGMTMFDCVYWFIYGNPKDVVTQIWSELNTKEEAQVLEVFGKWAQEQEEE